MITTFLAVPAFFLTVAAGEPQQAALERTIVEQQNQAVILSDEERDVGLVGYTSPQPCRPLYSENAVMIGPAAGDPEKDTYARPAVGQECR
jgi:hypothetical protein